MDQMCGLSQPKYWVVKHKCLMVRSLLWRPNMEFLNKEVLSAIANKKLVSIDFCFAQIPDGKNSSEG